VPGEIELRRPGTQDKPTAETVLDAIDQELPRFLADNAPGAQLYAMPGPVEFNLPRLRHENASVEIDRAPPPSGR
jgi:hypothetical protein